MAGLAQPLPCGADEAREGAPPGFQQRTRRRRLCVLLWHVRNHHHRQGLLHCQRIPARVTTESHWREHSPVDAYHTGRKTPASRPVAIESQSAGTADAARLTWVSCDGSEWPRLDRRREIHEPNTCTDEAEAAHCTSLAYDSTC